MAARLTRVGLVAVLALLAGAGCGSITADAGDGTVGGPQPVAGSASAPAISVADRAVLLLAEAELTSRCMADQGFDYPAVAPTEDELRELEREEAEAAAAGPRWFGSDDVDAAQRDGYGHAYRHEHPEPELSLADAPAPTDQLTPAERAAYGEALHGDVGQRVYIDLPYGEARLSMSTSGCIWEANQRLYGDVVRFHEASERAGESRLRFQTMELVQSDPAYQAALAGWRRCMERAGHRYDDPNQAQDEMGELFWRDDVDVPAARAREVEVAVADAACSREAGLAATAEDLSDRYEQEVAAGMEADVLAFQELHAEAVARARELLDLG